MKLLFSLIALMMLSKECDNKNSTNELPETTMEQQEKLASFENAETQSGEIIMYEASTRGFYEKIWVTKDSIKISSDRSLKDVSGILCPESDWNELKAAMKDVELLSLHNIEVPSKKFQFDGAAMATLKVENGDMIFSSPIFDHGNPPETIGAVVKKVLSMAEMVKKQ